MVTDIKVNVKSICFGSEDIELIFGDTVIPFYASYLGPEPISTLIDSLIALEIELILNADQSYYVRWADEPGYLSLEMWKKKESDLLHVSDPTLLEYRKKGLIPDPVKVDGRVLYDKAEVREALKKHRIGRYKY